jgi:hypothetical protein
LDISDWIRVLLSSTEYDGDGVAEGGVLLDVADVVVVDDDDGDAALVLEEEVVDDEVALLATGVLPSFLACPSAITNSLFSKNVFVDMP